MDQEPCGGNATTNSHLFNIYLFDLFLKKEWQRGQQDMTGTSLTAWQGVLRGLVERDRDAHQKI